MIPKIAEEFERRMHSWWTTAAAEREPSHRADPVEFGIDPDRVRPAFARYAECARRWTAH